MSRDAAIRRIVALHAPGLRAEIREKRALRYGTDPGSASGIASHVRAASAIRRHGSRLIVIQDDVNALAVMDASSRIKPLLMPPGADGRRSFDDTIGNKHLKMDLEAAVVLQDARVLAFGSGSTRARVRPAQATLACRGIRRRKETLSREARRAKAALAVLFPCRYHPCVHRHCRRDCHGPRCRQYRMISCPVSTLSRLSTLADLSTAR